jgi:hypothetical protein
LGKYQRREYIPLSHAAAQKAFYVPPARQAPSASTRESLSQWSSHPATPESERFSEPEATKPAGWEAMFVAVQLRPSSVECPQGREKQSPASNLR